MWRQQLESVLFLHWPAPAAFLRRYVPPVLAIDQFDGQAWVSLVVMRMHVLNTALPFPTLRFNQVNLRTYVRYGEQSGIWFFSVHANHLLAVTTARLATPIPYQVAFIQYGFATSEKFAHAKCNRSCRLQLALRFSVNAELAVSDPLHTWLLERYHLFTLGQQGRLLLGTFRHPPWLTQTVQIARCHLQAAPIDQALFSEPPALAHFSPGTEGEFGTFQQLCPAHHSDNT